jgi:hypothetical protein
MDRREDLCRLGGDRERLDQNGDPFKDARNRHKEALLFKRVLAEKAVGANDPALAELSCNAEILPSLAAGRAVRILARAPHCRNDEVPRTNPSHVGTDLHNLGKSFVTEDEFSGAGRRRPVFERRDLAIRTADSHFDCSQQHLRAAGPVRYRSFHQAYLFLLWGDDDGAHRPGGSIRYSPTRSRRFPASHCNAGGRSVAPKDFQRQASNVVEACLDSREVEPFDDDDTRPEENAVDLGTFIAAANRQVIDSDHPNPPLGEQPRSARIKVGVVFDETVHIPTTGGVICSQQ